VQSVFIRSWSSTVLRWSGACAVAAAVLVPAAAHGQVKNWPSESPPLPLPARDVTFPPYQIKSLPNGLKVVVVLHHEQPIVSLRLLVRAGSAADPHGREGLASLLASLLDQGTTKQSAHEIADQIDSIGGDLGSGASSDLSFASVVVMKDSFGAGLDLLSDVVRHPAFKVEEIERQRQQALSGLQVNNQDPDYVASTVFDRLVYGFHPYGLPNSGTPKTLASISPDDLHAFHEQYVVPNNAFLAIVGDVSADDAFASAERVFGSWARRELPQQTITEPPAPTRRVVVIDKPDAVQTEIRVGQLVLARTHPDYLAMDLAIRILGGEGSNRLYRVLRTERGLTYGAQAELSALAQAGDFVADTDTRTETTGEALRLIVDEISRLQRERVSERELADAQAYLAGSFPLTIETPDAIAGQILNVLFYDLPLSDLQTYRERVNAITPDDIQRVARTYLRPDRLSVVLVGNATGFAPQLKGLGFERYDLVSLQDLDVTTADLHRPGVSPTATPAARPNGPQD
jgi:zinc protease